MTQAKASVVSYDRNSSIIVLATVITIVNCDSNSFIIQATGRLKRGLLEPFLVLGFISFCLVHDSNRLLLTWILLIYLIRYFFFAVLLQINCNGYSCDWRSVAFFYIFNLICNVSRISNQSFAAAHSSNITRLTLPNNSILCLWYQPEI